jgi:transposase
VSVDVITRSREPHLMRRRRRRYDSDLSDTARAPIARFTVPDHPRAGRPCPPARWREYLDAILYVLRTGCAWRHPPHDFTVS